MAEFTTVGLEEVEKAFLRMEEAAVTAVPKMLKAGANVLVEAQRAEALAMGLNETGGFVKSIKATAVKGNDTGNIIAKAARIAAAQQFLVAFIVNVV